MDVHLYFLLCWRLDQCLYVENITDRFLSFPFRPTIMLHPLLEAGTGFEFSAA